MKKLAYIVSILAMAGLLVVTSYAHSGRIDGSGGHYDSSKGEYHYHHGYPAHDHYDIDGDGKADCPYEFNDKTDHSNHGSSSNSTNKKNDKSTTSATEIKVETFTENTETVSANNKITFGIVIKIIISIIRCAFLFLVCEYAIIAIIGGIIITIIELLPKKFFKSRNSVSKQRLTETAQNRIWDIINIVICVLAVILSTLFVLTVKRP